MKKDVAFEKLVEKIYKDLEPNADIKQNDFIMGNDTGIARQIDVSIRSKVAQTDILIIVQAKDWKYKPDIKTVGEFISVVKDVGANKGIMVSRLGFSKTAIKYAKNKGIELCTAHSAEEKDWSLEIKIPVILSKLEITVNFNVLLPCFDVKVIDTSRDAVKFSFNNGKDELSLIEVFFKSIDDRNIDISKSVGNYNLNSDNLMSQVDGKWERVERLIMDYRYLKTKYHLYYYTPMEYRALKNVINERMTHSYINYDDVIPKIDFYNMKEIKKEEINDLNSLKTFINMKAIAIEDKMYAQFNVITN